MVRKLPVIIGSLCAFSASGACSKEGSYHRMSDLRWLCEVAHTWGETLVGRCPSGVSRSVGTLSDADDVQRCDFCKHGHVTGRNEGISFRHWTDKGYAFCRADADGGPSRQPE